MFQKKRTNQKGQAVLIVLLSLSVVLIIVLYIMSRSITDISLSNKEEDSMRAFSAAEAGVERALVIGTGVGETTIGNAKFSAGVTDLGKGQNQMVYPMNLKSGEIATFWFSRPSEPAFTGDRARICWGSTISAVETPAVEISVFHTVAGVVQIARAPMDPNSGRTATNKFTVASTSPCTIDGQSFQYQATINLAALGSLQFMSVKTLYNTTVATKIGIDVSSATGSYTLLPSQGVRVNADGSFADANRSIEVSQLYPVAPSVFMNAIYSSTGITK